MAMTGTNNPGWWNDTHTSGWERAKEALKRDWEQTKNDFSSKRGAELNQDVGDTVRQATGKQAVPPVPVPNPPDAKHTAATTTRTAPVTHTTTATHATTTVDRTGAMHDWDGNEHAVRYGWGASSQYKDSQWDDSLEAKLRSEWDTLKYGRSWDESRHHVRRGWDAGRLGSKTRH